MISFLLFLPVHTGYATFCIPPFLVLWNYPVVIYVTVRFRVLYTTFGELVHTL